MYKVCTDYIVESNSILERFAKHMGMKLDEEITRENWIGVGRLPWMVWIGDYFFSLDNMVDTLEYDVPADTVFEWYEKSLEDHKNGKEMKALSEYIKDKTRKPIESYQKAKQSVINEFSYYISWDKPTKKSIDNYPWKHTEFSFDDILNALYYQIPKDTIIEYIEFKNNHQMNITTFWRMRQDTDVQEISNLLSKK